MALACVWQHQTWVKYISIVFKYRYKYLKKQIQILWNSIVFKYKYFQMYFKYNFKYMLSKVIVPIWILQTLAL